MGVSQTDSDSYDKADLGQDVVGLGLILEAHYALSDHFSVRFSIVPDFTLITIDRMQFTEDGKQTTFTRTEVLTFGYSVSARLGMSYKF